MRSKISSLSVGRGARVLFVTGGIASPVLAHAEGMPQLEFGNWLVQAQIFWGAGIFFIFLLALKYTVMPKVEKMLSVREERIEADLAYAKEAQKEAETLQEEIEAEIQASRLKTQKKMQEIADSRRQKLKAQEKELRHQMEKKLSSAVEKIDISVKEARANLNQVILPVTELIVRRCLDDGGGAHNAPERHEERKSMILHHATNYQA